MKDTHDKEWKIWCYDCKKLVTFYYRSDDCCPECHQGNIYHIHNEALDQIRRDAVEQTREIIKERILSHATHRHMHSRQGNDWTCLDEVYASIMADQDEDERAKTLGGTK